MNQPLPAPPPRPPVRTLLLALGGSAAAVTLAALLADSLSTALLMGSFGATCCLVFGFPDGPFSQPRAVMGGHLLSVLVGLAALHWVGPMPWALGLAVGVATAGMMTLRVMHPPAASNPVIVFLGGSGWGFALFPALVGALLIVLVALAWNNGVRRVRYPLYW